MNRPIKEMTIAELVDEERHTRSKMNKTPEELARRKEVVKQVHLLKEKKNNQF